MNERKIEGKEKNKTSKRLLASGVLLASLLGGQAFAISLGQGFPQVVRQSVIINEKLQQGENDVKLLAAKLENASGGLYQKPLKSIGGLSFETQYSTGFNLTLSANLRQSFLNNYRARYYDPIMGRFLQTDPIGYNDSMNLYQGMGNNTVNFLDPMGKWTLGVHKDITKASWTELTQNLQNSYGIIEQTQNDVMGLFEYGLNIGCKAPDIPTGKPDVVIAFIAHIIEANTPMYPIPNNDAATIARVAASLTHDMISFRSHYGDLSYWHSMRLEGQSSAQVQNMMIKDITKWISDARDLLLEGMKESKGDDKTMKISKAGFLVGAALHLIEDSFCPGHTKRNDNQIISQFKIYGKDSGHAKLDKYSDKTRVEYNRAVSAAFIMLDMFFQDSILKQMGGSIFESALNDLLLNNILRIK